MDIPKPAAERMIWSLLESAKEIVDANPEQVAKLALSHRNALLRIKNRNVQVETIVDIGAARGDWSKNAKTVWPAARCHMIEANHQWERELHELAADSAYSYVIAAAGPSKGEGLFKFVDDPFGGTGATVASAEATRVPQVTIDSECEDRGLKAPFLLKFDTHGFEREILKGAGAVLASTSLTVMEVYNFGPREKRFPAMMELMEDLGFRCIDIGEPMFRPYDKSLWQMDFFLVPINRPEFEHRGYK